MNFLFIGVSVVWIGILAYVIRIHGEQKKVTEQLERLTKE